MIDFLNDIKELFTKKVIIITLSILALITAGIVAAVMIHNSIPEKKSYSKDLRVTAEIYTLEIEGGSDITAESIYQKLAKDNNELKLLSMESDKNPQVVKLSSNSNDASSLEICFADGNTKKSFTTAGKYEETLIVHNQIDQSISSLNINLIVKDSKISAATTAETTATKISSTAVSKTTASKVTTLTSKRIYKIDEYVNNYDNYGDGDNDNDYNYDDNYDYNTDYDYDYSYDDYYNNEYNSGNDSETDNTNSENNSNTTPSDNQIPEEPSDELPKFETAEDFGWTGIQAEQFNYALSQGCNVWQASAYANACLVYGEENIFIGITPADGTCWGVWYYDEATGTYRSA